MLAPRASIAFNEAGRRILTRTSQCVTPSLRASWSRVYFFSIHSKSFQQKTFNGHLALTSSRPAINHVNGIIYSSFSSGPNRQNPFFRGGKNTGALGAIGAGSLLLLSKSKYLLATLKLTKFATLGSMILTVGTYTAFFGLPYAAGIVGLTVLHESGHALVMKRMGIPFDPMVFVPFLGAGVSMKKSPRDAYDEALIAMGGPVLGSLGAAGVCVVGHLTQSQLAFALADFGFMINLFNLIPLGSLDGGRICGALSPYTGLVGLGIGGSLIASGHISNPIFYLVMIAGGWDTFQKLRPGNDYMSNLPRGYYRITEGQKIAIGGGYVALLGGLFGAMAINDHYKKSPERLAYERKAGKGGLSNMHYDY